MSLAHNDKNFYVLPHHRVVAFYDSRNLADKAVAALVKAGFEDDLIDEAVGKEGLRFLDPDAEHHGFITKVIRLWQRLAQGEEAAYLDRVKKELTAGHVLVSTPVMTNEACHQVADVLADCGGKHIRYYGLFHVENLDK